MAAFAVAQPSRSLRTAGVLPVILALALLAWPAASPQAAERFVSVIVQATSAQQAHSAVAEFDGRVVRDLPIVNGVEARVAKADIAALRNAPQIVSVTRNAPVAFQGKPAKGATYIAPSATLRSDLLRSKTNNTGRGVTIAVLDTGVHAAHPDLSDLQTGASRVIHCVDFSAEGASEAQCQDTFGHGTFMAGLMAGNGASSGGTYQGTAPEASIVSVKLAGFDGSSDVSKVLAGIQWAVAHKDAYGIDVMNLSLGTDSAQTYRLAPLNYAVERAWGAGITVVVSVGNTGPNSSTVMKPSDDPYVVTVGASDSQGSSSIRDDAIAVFSGRGPTRTDLLAKPDVVAPGVHTISLRSPGSAIDQKYPGSVVGGGYFKGTGTSMATASISGVVAQILAANPSLTPDQVKARLMDTARQISTTDPNAVGKGLVDAYAAATSSSTRAANSELGPPPQSTPLGLLETDRGSVEVEVQSFAGEISLTGEFMAKTDPNEVDLLNPGGLVPWVGVGYATFGWDATNWSGTNWSGTNWSGTNWSATNWSGTNWSATNWSGTNWSGTNWSNADWNATNWSGTNWSATNWSATNWSSAWYAAAWD